MFFPCNEIIIVAEYRVFLLNYLTLQHRVRTSRNLKGKLEILIQFLFFYTKTKFQEIKLSQFDNKVQNLVVPLGTGSKVAFGGSDGAIRIFDISTLTLHCKLSNAHKNVEHIWTAQVGKDKLIISAGSENSLSWWRSSGANISFSDEPINKKVRLNEKISY